LLSDPASLLAIFALFIASAAFHELGRTAGGRLRTDPGGLYFNLISILALAGLYAGTNAEILLLAIAVIQLEMLEQLPQERRDPGEIPGPADHRHAARRPRRGHHLGAVRHRAGHVPDGTGPVPRLVTTPPGGFARRLLRRQGGSG
jgi:hypothetical protein